MSDAAVVSSAETEESITRPRETFRRLVQGDLASLRVVIGLDAVSAGRVLGKRPGAVRTAAYRGLRRLAASLDDDGSPYEARPPRPGVIRGRLSTLM